MEQEIYKFIIAIGFPVGILIYIWVSLKQKDNRKELPHFSLDRLPPQLYPTPEEILNYKGNRKPKPKPNPKSQPNICILKGSRYEMRGPVRRANLDGQIPSLEEEELTRLNHQHQRNRGDNGKAQPVSNSYKSEKKIQERYVNRGKRTIAVDLDATIAKSKSAEKRDRAPELIGLMDGAKETLQAWRDDGKYILIHTARLNDYWEHQDFAEMLQTIKDFLEKYDAPYDEIWTGRGKPYAAEYVDDAARRFKEDFLNIRWQIEGEKVLEVDLDMSTEKLNEKWLEYNRKRWAAFRRLEEENKYIFALEKQTMRVRKELDKRENKEITS